MSEPQAHELDEQHEAASSGPVQHDRSKHRILLADDSVAARVLTSALIRRMGFDVHTVANGEEALNSARATAYDMVILDIDMPVIDGISTARDLKTIRDMGGKPLIVAMSAYLNEFSGADDWQGLFDATIAKPVSRHQLLEAIVGLLPASQLVKRSNMVDERYRECPVVNTPMLELQRDKAESEAWIALVSDTTRQLREIATNLDQAIAAGDKDFMIRVKALIDVLPLASVTTQLARRAAAFDVAANTLPASALADQAQRLVGCALSTVVQLNRHLTPIGKPPEAETEET